MVSVIVTVEENVLVGVGAATVIETEGKVTVDITSICLVTTFADTKLVEVTITVFGNVTIFASREIVCVIVLKLYDVSTGIILVIIFVFVNFAKAAETVTMVFLAIVVGLGISETVIVDKIVDKVKDTSVNPKNFVEINVLVLSLGFNVFVTVSVTFFGTCCIVDEIVTVFVATAALIVSVLKLVIVTGPNTHDGLIINVDVSSGIILSEVVVSQAVIVSTCCGP